jgi:hypothetical protein
MPIKEETEQRRTRLGENTQQDKESVLRQRVYVVHTTIQEAGSVQRMYSIRRLRQECMTLRGLTHISTDLPLRAHCREARPSHCGRKEDCTSFPPNLQYDRAQKNIGNSLRPFGRGDTGIKAMARIGSAHATGVLAAVKGECIRRKIFTPKGLFKGTL